MSKFVAVLNFPVKNMLETTIWLVQRVLLWSISALGLAWIYKEITMGICHSKKRLDGKVAIVTGKILSHLHHCYGNKSALYQVGALGLATRLCWIWPAGGLRS